MEDILSDGPVPQPTLTVAFIRWGGAHRMGEGHEPATEGDGGWGMFGSPPCDWYMDAVVTRDQAEEWARANGMLFLECSAKTRAGIQAVDEGQIERRRGQGTSRVASYIVFDIAVPGPQDIDEYRRLTSGVVPRLLHRSWTPAPAPLARRLTGVATGEPCLAIEYVLNARNEPIAVITNYLRASEGEMVAEVPFVADFYTFLLDAGVDIADQATTLQARLADNEVAPLLDVEVGSPVLAFEQAIRNGRGEVVDVALGVFRDDVRMTASNFVYRPPG